MREKVIRDHEEIKVLRKIEEKKINENTRERK